MSNTIDCQTEQAGEYPQSLRVRTHGFRATTLAFARFTWAGRALHP